MPVLNSDTARDLEKLADLIELDGGNPFRIGAYRNAARIVAELPRTIAATMAAAAMLQKAQREQQRNAGPQAPQAIPPGDMVIERNR